MNDRIKVIFKKAAPSGFEGYGAETTVGEKQLENFQKTGMYDIEVLGKHSVKPDPGKEPKKKTKAKAKKKS